MRLVVPKPPAKAGPCLVDVACEQPATHRCVILGQQYCVGACEWHAYVWKHLNDPPPNRYPHHPRGKVVPSREKRDVAKRVAARSGPSVTVSGAQTTNDARWTPKPRGGRS